MAKSDIVVGEPVIKIQRWPVLTREQTSSGGLAQAPSSYKRTAAPTATRSERFVSMDRRSRVVVTWDSTGTAAVSTAEFSLKTGRMIQQPDWLLTRDSLKALRKLARSMFPEVETEKPATASAVPPESDDAHPLEVAARIEAEGGCV
jgi:hypothetical protein